ncbi:transposase [Streptomyces sp. NPDC002073]
MLQFLLGFSDRQAAEAVRCRIDFKYAMAMELEDPGFHHSVLADFRDRLADGDRADRLLDLALTRLKEAGPVHERTIQCTDSTHVLAAVRDLTRLELITEAVRAALGERTGRNRAPRGQPASAPAFGRRGRSRSCTGSMTCRYTAR